MTTSTTTNAPVNGQHGSENLDSDAGWTEAERRLRQAFSTSVEVEKKL